MDRDKQKEIASKGGKAAHQKGTAHEWTSEEARDAGRKGGLASHRRRREQKDGDTRELVGIATGAESPAGIAPAFVPRRHESSSNWTMIARSDCGGAPTGAAASAAS